MQLFSLILAIVLIFKSERLLNNRDVAAVVMILFVGRNKSFFFFNKFLSSLFPQFYAKSVIVNSVFSNIKDF